MQLTYGLWTTKTRCPQDYTVRLICEKGYSALVGCGPRSEGSFTGVSVFERGRFESEDGGRRRRSEDGPLGPPPSITRRRSTASGIGVEIPSSGRSSPAFFPNLSLPCAAEGRSLDVPLIYPALSNFRAASER